MAEERAESQVEAEAFPEVPDEAPQPEVAKIRLKVRPGMAACGPRPLRPSG
jgi:hypothetical protein